MTTASMRHMEITMVEVVKANADRPREKEELSTRRYRQNASSIAHQSSALLLAPSTAPNRENASQKTAAMPSAISGERLGDFI